MLHVPMSPIILVSQHLECAAIQLELQCCSWDLGLDRGPDALSPGLHREFF
jgi:hypothetical protein